MRRPRGPFGRRVAIGVSRCISSRGSRYADRRLPCWPKAGLPVIGSALRLVPPLHDKPEGARPNANSGGLCSRGIRSRPSRHVRCPVTSDKAEPGQPESHNPEATFPKESVMISINGLDPHAAAVALATYLRTSIIAWLAFIACSMTNAAPPSNAPSIPGFRALAGPLSQSDGKVVYAGYAYHVNGSGKIVFLNGDLKPGTGQYEGYLQSLALEADGKVAILYDGIFHVAEINPDGTLHESPPGVLNHEVDFVTVIEYHAAEFDHYFLASDPSDPPSLDNTPTDPSQRTGSFFHSSPP